MAVSYLSVNRFLGGGYGVDTTDMTRSDLRGILVRSSTRVNRYCSVPAVSQAFDFRGGSVIAEQHQWPYTSPLLVNAGTRRVYLNHKPVRTVTSFVLRLAKNYTATINPVNDIVVNHQEGYAEIVALSPAIAGYFPVGWNFGLWNPIAEIDYTYGWVFEVTGDECEAESPTIYSASYGNWTDDAPTVYVDGIEVDDANYSVNATDGYIIFAAAAEPSIQSVVTVDYAYAVPDAISQATGIIATSIIGGSRMAARGMLGLHSLRVAEVALTALAPNQMVVRNGASVPPDAADLLGAYVMGSVG